MRLKHDMPFGAQCLESGGGVRFRLWAPAAKKVQLCLTPQEATDASPSRREMPEVKDGWFELVAEDIKAGQLYKFHINGDIEVPDPASRFQPEDVHGPSEVINPEAFEWKDEKWYGRDWHEAVIYELHVGTFTSQGTFSGVEQKLDYLRDLGVTAIELMPLSDFSGRWNWGYDGVFPYAPDSSYGTPEDLKRLVQAVHAKGLMMFLDVVYNHFGPDGNYLRSYAPEFFTTRHHTPWGEAINYDGPCSRVVRDFFIHNAIYWLEEYRFDGLRLDAVHAIADDSKPDILEELAQNVRQKFTGKRQVHLVLENEANAVRYLERDKGSHPKFYDAQWNDDIHHALHVIATGETDGYYSDYTKHPIEQLGRCLAEGFAFQNDPSEYRNNEKRGECSKHLPLEAFIAFLQNHDQVGNRAMGDRIIESAKVRALKALMGVVLFAPSPPLIFMGEEFRASTPFLFFSDFQGNLAKAVTDGRRNEFRRFKKFSDPASRAKIPDPNSKATFADSKLDWEEVKQPQHEEWLHFYQRLLQLRMQRIVPLLRDLVPGSASFRTFAHSGLKVQWPLKTGRKLILIANLGEREIQAEAPCSGELLYSAFPHSTHGDKFVLGVWSVFWYLQA
jgi:maltooligosyltrehalose trehalohydrolase